MMSSKSARREGHSDDPLTRAGTVDGLPCLRPAPPAHYAQRMRVFFREMLPLAPHALLAAVIYVAVASFIGFTARIPISFWSLATVVGIASVSALFLMVRLMDELKDVEVDRRLFPHRPVPSGRVKLSDVRMSLAGVIVLYSSVNALLPAALWTAAAALGYALLMFRFFFAPRLIRQSLPLALATHNPIVPLMLLHCMSVAAAAHGLELVALDFRLVVPFLLLTWMPLLAWELSRKIRAPQEETEYVTYSRVFGLKGAVGLTLLVQSLAVALGAVLYVRLDLAPLYPAILAAALMLSMAFHLRLLIAPAQGSSWLRPATEFFGVGIYGTQILAFLWPGSA